MLIRPWLAPFIIAFWCLTTGWLLVAKILPSLSPGSPPGYQALYMAGSEPIAVAWSVLWNDQPLGWAASQAYPAEGGEMTVESLMNLDRVSIDEILPGWGRGLMRRFAEVAASEQTATSPRVPERAPSAVSLAPSVLSLRARGRLAIDAAGGLRSFSSSINLPGTSDVVQLDGTVDDGHVRVAIRAGELRYEASRHLPSTIVLGDEFSPQATMPGLEPGKRWTIPTYSPLRFGGSPIDVLHAHVVGEETMFWEDHLVRAHVVEYRDDPVAHHKPRARLWVDKSGRVLRQDSQFFGSTLSFVRRSDDAARALSLSLESSSEEP